MHLWSSYNDLCDTNMVAAAILDFESKSVDIWRSYSDLCKSNMAAAAILVFEFLLPVLSRPIRTRYEEPVFQIWLKSVHKWRSYSDFCKINMAAAAILVFGFYFRFAGFRRRIRRRTLPESFMRIGSSVSKLLHFLFRFLYNGNSLFTPKIGVFWSK